MLELIIVKGSRTSTKSFPSVQNSDTEQTLALWPCQTVQSMATCGLEESGGSTPVSHHQLCLISRSEEEEQEDEKEKKRGDATLDDSHLTVHMICNSCGCIYCYLTYYYTRIHQITIVSHSTTSSQLIVVPVTSLI